MLRKQRKKIRKKKTKKTKDKTTYLNQKKNESKVYKRIPISNKR